MIAFPSQQELIQEAVDVLEKANLGLTRSELADRVAEVFDSPPKYGFVKRLILDEVSRTVQVSCYDCGWLVERYEIDDKVVAVSILLEEALSKWAYGLILQKRHLFQDLSDRHFAYQKLANTVKNSFPEPYRTVLSKKDEIKKKIKLLR